MKVFIIAALTADGFIARHSAHTADWSVKEDKQLYVRLTKEAGVMIMGARTFDTIGRALPERKTIVYTSNPDAYTGFDIETTKEAPKDLLKRLEKEGYTSVAICGGAQIYTHFLQAGAVTDLHLTYAPLLFGKGIPLFADNFDIQLKLVSVEKLGVDSLYAHYTVLA